MSYTSVFGGTTIYPSDVSYLALALSADASLEWPLESNDPSTPAARIIDVTATGAHAVTLPDATQTGAGQTILFNNLAASSSSFTVKDAAGATIATVAVGEQWQVYLSDTSTAAGTWRVFRYGASTATVQASALAGYGLTVTANTLSQSTPVTTFNASPRTALITDRASALVWTGTGSGTLNLMAAADAGNNFFIGVRNSGGGDLTIDPAGGETVDGAATLALRPGESATLLTNGLVWYTFGLGQEAVFAFDYTSISVTGGNYTLSGSELNRIAYQFVGVLASDQYIIVPATVQQYWVDNATTGPFALYLQTSGGTPASVTQGARGIYYCNGTNVVDADTSTVSLPVSAADGGTGITNYTTGDLLYANSATTLARLADAATGNALISGGVGVAPAWGKIGLTTHVSGTLGAGNGGSGASSLTGYLKGNGASAFTASTTIPASDIGSGAALTKVDDTNVTLTLGGTPASALLAATSLTLGWSGQLAVSRGGTGVGSAPTNGQLLIGNGAGYTLAGLTAGAGIGITNGAGSVTIAATGPGSYPGAGVAVSTGSAWGTSLAAPSGALVGTTDAQTLSNKNIVDPAITGTISEDIYTIVDGAAFEIDPGNGSIQQITLGANRTPKATNFANGESVTLSINDGTAYTLTWTDTTFGASGVAWIGGSAPALATTGLTWVTFWKVGGQVYGALTGTTT